MVTEDTIQNGSLDIQVCQLQEIAHVNQLSIDDSFTEEFIEYIDIASVKQGELKNLQKLHIQNAPTRAKRIVRKNDILISTVRPNLKHYMFVKEANSNTIASTGFVVITPKKIDPYFLYCYLTTPEFVKYLTQIAETHTSAYPSFKPEVIENARIHFPSSLQVQRKISMILRNFEDKIECNIRIAKILDDLCNLIFKMHFSMNENRNYWKIDRLKNHIKFIKGKKPRKLRYDKQEGDLPVILINSIDTGNFLYSNPQNQILCNEKDVLMVLDGASSGRVEKGYQGIIGSTLAKLLVVSNSITREFLYLYLKEKYNQINYNVTGSAIPHADKRYILLLKILIPDSKTLESFQKIIEPYFEYRRIIRKENYFLKELINYLKTSLISGRLKTKKVL